MRNTDLDASVGSNNDGEPQQNMFETIRRSTMM